MTHPPLGALAPLRHQPFRYLITGRFVTMLGNAVAPIALAFAVLDLTGSVRDLGLVVGARSLMTVVFVLFGGVVADRFPRHLVMVSSNAFAALTQATVAALVLSGTATVGLLTVLAAANGIVASFTFPSAQALIAQSVPEDLRLRANALNRLASNSALIGGAAVGGVLVAAVGPGWGLAADAATFALAGVAFAMVRVPGVRDRSAPRTGVLADLRVGWTEFVSRTWTWAVVLGFMFLNAAFTGAMAVLGPVVADGSIGRSAWGFVLAANTAGMVVGALVALRLRVRRLLFVGVLCMLGEVPVLLALALEPSVAILMLCTFAGGIAVEQFAVAWDTSVQQYVPADKLARVYSYDLLGSIVAVPIGQVVAGPVALAVGTGPALLGAAAIVVLSVVGMVASRDVRQLGSRPSLATQEPAVSVT
ncbi:MAG TPA: MFS transporter [Micromonosporaceae bacterium]|nr:MFS transporter [Micromonosporaceae bacterium]